MEIVHPLFQHHPIIMLYSANELAKRLLPGSDFNTANAFAVAHVSAAIENIAEWKFFNSTSARIDLDAIVREVREMSMSWQSKDAIVGALQTAQNTAFACEWALPEFKFNESGFLLVGKNEAPFTCKYCGSPSWIDPSDQSPPPDYCHEIDHGTAEERAVFGSDSAGL
ncbi:hypothetical protein [Acidithiobacillus ferrivorans]|uniref:Uncharacterized protein n=1 Tax=Acidithiobacillus ferrivorans TaxID=160808 RepID=A0A7T4WE65_9PROT|nr:hypothetical protein [Acidithiobacillus ferrivorans]QQD72988.1 hypothetical protein H2515_01210 [Acidithiobacillus ferrivorans]